MNEKLKELAEQARQYAWVNETHWSAGPERERLFEQKFAELIVKECCQVMESLPSTTYHVGRSRMSEEIKLHFGVEE